MNTPELLLLFYPMFIVLMTDKSFNFSAGSFNLYFQFQICVLLIILSNIQISVLLRIRHLSQSSALLMMVFIIPPDSVILKDKNFKFFTGIELHRRALSI